ncbi:hypothetical protein Cgig2_026177 [Carnegiea gigantea]|uniref:F-box associated beta-propeller type 1 domain-containing protein n=1 Tax=Carnegiea gigantea TaxID=171969 RepID=A0A9Q1K4Y7_9CARY|nr:hypothetical protein Cgig2_026177 [Carnegiea gigantea]
MGIMNLSNPKLPKAALLLSSDVILEILLRLPVKSLIHFTCVSFAFDTNGVYLIDDLNSPNPQPTKTAKREFFGPEGLHESDIMTGFGYDCETDDYKVVVALLSRGDTFVYSLKANLWRRLRHQSAPQGYLFSRSFCANRECVFWNGTLHWVILVDDNEFRIVGFNLFSEEWDATIRQPSITNPPMKDEFYSIVLGRLHECLCIGLHREVRDTTIEIWIMKDYVIETSWSKLASISELKDDPMWTTAAFITHLKSRSKVLVQSIGKDKPNNRWYDVEQKTLAKFDIGPLRPFCSGFTVCFESLVSATMGSIEKQKRD